MFCIFLHIDLVHILLDLFQSISFFRNANINGIVFHCKFHLFFAGIDIHALNVMVSCSLVWLIAKYFSEKQGSVN